MLRVARLGRTLKCGGLRATLMTACSLWVALARGETQRAQEAQEAQQAQAKQSHPPSRARLVSPLEGPEVNTLGVEADGTRRTLSHGLRALVHPDGAIEMAGDEFPLARSVQLFELPRRFGHGFLFAMSGSGRASLWFAKTFIDKLVPFAALDFEIERIVAGFDRLYVQARRSGDWIALEANTGAGAERGSLPPAPSYGTLAFADAWFGAVELPIQGVVASFDAGVSWHPLGRQFKLVGEDAGEIVVATPEGRKKLAPDGSLRAVETPTVESTNTGVVRRSASEGPAGPNPLASAVARGIADGPDSALVLQRGALSRVRLSDGRVLDTRPRMVAPSATCSALPLGKGLGFVCQEPRGKTQIHAVKQPLGLDLVESYESPRAVLSSGNGGLVVRGGCGALPAEAARVDVHCVRTPQGEHFEVTNPSSSVARVVALRDGSAALVVPPQNDKPGALTRVQANAKRTTLALSFDEREEPVRTLLHKGFWLDSWVETDKGDLAGWVAGQSTFVGVRISPDGHVHAGVLRRRVERALISGERALLIAAAGIAEQSVDAGKTFTDVDLPPELTLEAAKIAALGPNLEQGCSALGCSFAGWLRVGWDGPSGGSPLTVAALPTPTSLPQPGGGRWILRCAPTGEASAPSLATPSASSNSENATPPWAALFDQPPPARPRDALGYDTGDAELRAYAWAPRGADFGRAGRFSVSVLDAHRVRGGVWTTLPSASPWSDPAQVAEIFGYEGSVPSSWRVNLDASGRAGVLSVSARGATELFAVAENRGVVPLLNASRQGVGTLASVVEMESGFYVAALEEPRSLRVFALEGGDARLLGQYADLPQGRGVAPVLVRSTRRDSLAIWTRGAGWYVFPIDLRSGAVSRAIEISARTLSRFPRACEPDEDGYLLEGPVGVEPYAEFVEGADKVVASGFTARFIASERGVCVVSLAARSDDSMEHKVTPRAKSRSISDTRYRVPLVVTDRTEKGRRWGFRCAN